MKRPHRLAAAAAMTGILISFACGGAGRNPVAPASTNQPPTVVKIELVGYAVVGIGQSVPVRADASDPDGDAVRCEWRAASGRVLVDSSNSCAGMYFAPATGATDSLTVTPIDVRGLAGSIGSLTVPLGAESIASGGGPNPNATPNPTPTPRPEPRPTPTPEPDPHPTPRPSSTPGPAPSPSPTPVTNHPPTITVSGGGSCHPTCSKALTAAASDPDGDSLSLTWSGACSGTSATASVTVSQVQTFDCTVTATDAKGATASASGSATGVNQAPSGACLSAEGSGSNNSGTVTRNGCTVTRALHEGVVFTISRSDPDGDSLGSTRWSPADALQCGSASDTSIHCNVRVGTDGGTLVAEFTDAWGAIGRVSWTVTP